MKRAAPLALFGLLVLACNGAASPAGGACLPIAPMQLMALEHGSEWEPVASLAADGTVSQAVNKSPGVAFVLAADEVREPSGTAKMTCDATHVLHVAGSPHAMRFDDHDALVGTGTDSTRIFVRDDGSVEMSLGGATRQAPWKVTGVTAATRRTAEILILTAMASASWGSD